MISLRLYLMEIGAYKISFDVYHKYVSRRMSIDERIEQDEIVNSILSRMYLCIKN